MNCERAENFLSAYLDDMLDPQLHEEVAAHLESCALCSEVVAEYRRFDMLLSGTPRVSPPLELREHIFSSPQFAAVLRQQAKPIDIPAHVTASRPHQSANRRSPPRWTRIALQTAAVFAIIVGSALLFKQGFFHSSPTTTGHLSTPIIGNPNPTGAPLAAGIRIIYLHDATLWSAPESGPGIGQQLTPAGIQVSATWSVSPNGRFVAYAEATSGRIHVVRADGQSDIALDSFSAICGSSSLCIDHPVLTWSPDGNHIAYQSMDGSLHMVNADGTNEQTLLNSEQGVATSLLWSSDSLRLAFVEVKGSLESIWNYDLVGKNATQVAASADPDDSNATVQEIFWLPDSAHPTLTWTTWEASTQSLTGIFARNLLPGSAVQPLTPPEVQLTAAGFTPRLGNGIWLVGAIDQSGAPEIGTVAPPRPGLVVTNNLPGTTISGVYWSPLGDTAALVSTTGQMFLATKNGASLQPPVFTSSVTGAPVWSPDGLHLATPFSLGIIISLNIETTSATEVTGVYRLLPSVPTPTTMTILWSPDSQDIAITSPSGTFLSSSDGKTIKQVDTQTATGPFSWSVAG